MPERWKWPSLGVVLLLMVGLLPIIYFVALWLGFTQSALGESISPAADGGLDRRIENVAFGVGEKLTFDINYGFINAGTATVEVLNLIEYNNRPAYQIVSRAQSNSFFSTFYKVDDRLESIMDAVGMFSWRFEKILREGSYASDREFWFDQVEGQAFYEDDTFDVPRYVQDVLSAFYYVRTQELKVGTTLHIDHFDSGKFYPLEVKIHKRETITVSAGTFDCIVVEPMLKSVGAFKQEGTLKVWLTDDRLHMPVQMKSKVLVGSISAELTGYELGEIEAF